MPYLGGALCHIWGFYPNCARTPFRTLLPDVLTHPVYTGYIFTELVVLDCVPSLSTEIMIAVAIKKLLLLHVPPYIHFRYSMAE